MMLPAVFFASRDGDVSAMAKLYREKQCDVISGLTFEENTVLHIAAREGHLELVTWILNNLSGCFTKARNVDENTPLHEAAKGDNEETISILLHHNNCVASKRNQFGETPLIIASENGHKEAVKVLLKVTPWFMFLWPRNDHQTCLHVAAYQGHLDVVKLLLESFNCWDKLRHLILLIGDAHGATPLHNAVHGGDINIVREIIRINLNSLCCKRWCCMSWCRMPWFDKNLMTKKDEHGRCPIHVAALKGSEEIIDVFMHSMPDCTEIRSRDLKTALHFAVEYNRFEVVQKLLSNVKPCEASKLVSCDRDISGNTTLHLAAMKGVDPELVKYLLSFPNTKVNAVNEEGLNAFDKATAAKFHEIAAILEENGATHSFIQQSNSESSRPSEYNNKNRNNDNDDSVMSVDTLVASLIATVTFAAIFEEPGGSNHDDKTASTSIALQTLFQVFLFSDCLAFFASMTVVMAWIFRERLQGKLSVDRSPLAKLSLLSLEISIMCTALAFVSAAILVTIPRDLHARKKEFAKDLNEYEFIFGGEILTASLVPAIAIMFLSLAWAHEYYFRATNDYQQKLRTQFRQVVIFIIPPCLLIFVVIVAYGLKQVK